MNAQCTILQRVHSRVRNAKFTPHSVWRRGRGGERRLRAVYPVTAKALRRTTRSLSASRHASAFIHGGCACATRSLRLCLGTCQGERPKLSKVPCTSTPNPSPSGTQAKPQPEHCLKHLMSLRSAAPLCPLRLLPNPQRQTVFCHFRNLTAYCLSFFNQRFLRTCHFRSCFKGKTGVSPRYAFFSTHDPHTLHAPRLQTQTEQSNQLRHNPQRNANNEPPS